MPESIEKLLNEGTVSDKEDIRRYLKVDGGKLYVCQETMVAEDCPITGDRIETIDSLVEIEVSDDLIAQILTVHGALASSRPEREEAGAKLPRRPSKKPSGASLEAFDKAWALYPRKDGKTPARKAWASQRCERHFDLIVADIIRRSSSPEWLKERGQYVPHMSTYLNQRRFEDTLEEGCGECKPWV
jgi:hypothetical protein